MDYSKAWQDVDGRWRGEDGQPLEREQVAELLKQREQQTKKAAASAEKAK